LLPIADADARAATEDMLPVPGGEFSMGADSGGENDEQPAHRVSIKAFLLDRTEVTNAAYLECVKAGACKTYREDIERRYARTASFRAPDQPAVGVSWFDAKAYCSWRGARLPTEAEWERAARADDNRRFAWGNEKPTPDRACYGRALGTKAGAPSAVGSHPSGKGAYGHLDLTGNVWEWVEDNYDPLAYRRAGASHGVAADCAQILETLAALRKAKKQGFTGSNPIPTTCERVLRGGAFNYNAEGLRVTNRVHHPPEWRLAVAGFRCAKDAPESSR
jgi:formylglycine-generating enzyme required for sulfatase activity